MLTNLLYLPDRRQESSDKSKLPRRHVPATKNDTRAYRWQLLMQVKSSQVAFNELASVAQVLTNFTVS